MNCLNSNDEDSTRFLWSVAIFAARETPSELLATIDSIICAASDRTVIDIMVNGNPLLASETARLIHGMPLLSNAPCLRVWSIFLGGKAHAWNQYVQHVWPGTDLAFFVDGYVRPQPDAFQLLATGMTAAPRSLAGTGVPASGRSALDMRDQMEREGGLHGNCFAIKQAVMNDFRDRNFRLPLGLYGFDSLLGAVLAFGLDPAKNQWNVKERVLAHPEVTWEIDEKKWWRFSVVKTQINRILNNALRVLVVQATIDHLARRKLPPELLPKTVEDFVLGWVKNNPVEARQTLLKSPLCRIAIAKLRKPRDWSAAIKPPLLVYESQKFE